MTNDDRDALRHVHALMFRLATLLLLLGGIVAALLWLVITRWAILPGLAPTRSSLSSNQDGGALGAAPVAVLVGAASLIVGLGLLGGWLATRSASPKRRAGTIARPVDVPSRRARRARLILALGLVFLVIALGLRWPRATSPGSASVERIDARRP